MLAIDLQNRPMAQDVKNPYAVECGERLRRFRLAVADTEEMRAFVEEVFAVSPEDMAELKRAETRYAKWESGANLVPSWFVTRLKRAYGVTTDYIFDGDISGVNPELRRKLIAREKMERGH